MCKYSTIFTIVDDFCKIYQEWRKHKLLQGNRQRIREGKLSLKSNINNDILSF